MTIRLRCAECRRKLKVPDEALGKKVQCPVCGARFRGRLDADAPPAAPQEPVGKERASAASPTDSASPSFPNIQLEEAAALEGIEPLSDEEPAGADEAEVMEAALPEEEGMEPIVMEDEAFQNLAQAEDEADAVDVVEEAVDEAEPEVIEEESAPKTKKSRRSLVLYLALAFVLVLGCVGLAFALYRYLF